MDRDVPYIKRALRLARRGMGTTNPNPMVGAVLVKNGRVIGEGYHRRPGEPHAEVLAIRNATEDPKGAELYLNLEPCCHYGRTPPCVDLIISSGIKRVVASIPDPNPLVNGRSFEKLRAAGVEVRVGVLSAEATRLNERFIYFMKRGKSFVLVKAALTLDGKIASASGRSEWITGEKARRFVHRLRYQYDGILVGARTVIIDDPLLTIRYYPKRKPLFRIVLDASLRVPEEARLFSTKDEGPILVFTTDAAPQDKVKRLQKKGIELIIVKGSERRVFLPEVMDVLKDRGVQSLIVEGGSEVIGSFLAAGLAVKLLLIYSPRILGGERAVPLVRGVGERMMDEAFRVYHLSSFRLGEDLAVEGYFIPEV
ncbi:MAG: bifunctional diaminohydroxyphosphoribosylaminopyrimidine deaminase/5-amino-6-(5-phosphoribosylamino)uracil reductase RibD [Acidobacteria bacterium]|nr:bifunctional diaminohydroxyphosphoribosylaminopyrimidine deaminase/5-amino-6-(5-phosphoribosylamino)uracil reductase RibD [Acidobacteriota bacterium]